MRQPIFQKNKTNINKGGNTAKKNDTKVKTTAKKTLRQKKPHKKYGTSKLEYYFATNFLDRLGLKYIYQYKADDMKRFFDFAIVETLSDEVITETKSGMISIDQSRQKYNIIALIEVEGEYWHSDPRIMEGKEMNNIQKKNKKVDEIKNNWCIEHHIPLIRFWEYDINNDGSSVLNKLKKLPRHKRRGIQPKKET